MGSQQANSPSLNYGQSSKLIVGHVDGTRLSCVVSVVLKVILTASESLSVARGSPDKVCPTCGSSRADLGCTVRYARGFREVAGP